MALDGMMIYALKEELNDAIRSGRVSKIYQPFERDLVIHIRAKGNNVRLLISANPTYPRLHFTQETFQNPKEAPMFCMLLRKHLEGGVIESVSQVGKERILHIDVRSKDELGDVTQKRLVIELMGRHSNIILLDPERNMILDSIHHVTAAINQHRTVLPGREYVNPPEQHKTNPFEVDGQTLQKKINFNQGKLDQQIVDQFSGVSPLLAKEILHLAGLPDREKLAQSFFSVIERIEGLDLQPCTLETESKSYFYLFPLEHLHAKETTFDTLSKMLEAYFHGKAERDQVKQKANDLRKFLTNERKKNEKKIKKLEKTQQDSKKSEEYKLFGELLTAYMHQVERGDSSVDVINYYDDQGATVTIPLDPEKTPNENAQQYFKAYNKAKKSAQVVVEQMNLARNEIEYLDVLIQQIDHASPSDVEDIREELMEEGYLKRKQQQKKKKRNDQPQLETYTSSEGVPILVGKNNKQNEYLTNRVSRSTDTWLHTKDIPGSHVVIRSTEYSEKTLLEAAEIAAYYSKARQSSQVPVDYTFIKHVRKPSGAKPGFVIYDHQQTVYVTPQEKVIQGLRTKG